MDKFFIQNCGNLADMLWQIGPKSCASFSTRGPRPEPKATQPVDKVDFIHQKTTICPQNFEQSKMPILPVVNQPLIHIIHIAYYYIQRIKNLKGL